MNSTQAKQLLADGGILTMNKDGGWFLHHPSFTKGYRKVGNITVNAIERHRVFHYDRLPEGGLKLVFDDVVGA